MKLENLLPIFAPAPPAVIMGIMLYNEIIAASSREWWVIAAAASIFGVIGMIGVEMYSYKQAMIAFARRETPAMVAALVGAIITSSLILLAVYRSENSRPLIASVLIAIAGYVALSVRDYMATRAAVQAETVSDANRETDNQVKLLEAQRKLQATQNKALKMSSGQTQFVQSVHRTSVQGLDADKLRITREILAKNPNATTREIAQALGFSSPSSGKTYKDAAGK